MRELFVYYRVRPGTLQAARQAVTTMQRELAAAHERLEARLLVRADAATGVETWMETYASHRDALAVVDDALEAEISDRALALAPFIDGARHIERFESLDRA